MSAFLFVSFCISLFGVSRCRKEDGESLLRDAQSYANPTCFGCKGIKNLIIAGVTTDVCVHTTMREANDRGFDCLLIEDGTAAAEQALHDAAVEMVRTEGGIFGATAKVEDVLEVLNHT